MAILVLAALSVLGLAIACATGRVGQGGHGFGHHAGRDEEQDIGAAIDSILAQRDVALEISSSTIIPAIGTGAIADEPAACADARIRGHPRPGAAARMAG